MVHAIYFQISHIHILESRLPTKRVFTVSGRDQAFEFYFSFIPEIYFLNLMPANVKKVSHASNRNIPYSGISKRISYENISKSKVCYVFLPFHLLLVFPTILLTGNRFFVLFIVLNSIELK